MIEYENLRQVNAPFEKELKKSFARLLTSGRYILGDHVARFEREFAAYVGTAHCVGVASGLDALTLSLRAANLPPDGEVIVAANTFVATVLAVLHAGLRPRLAEPNLATYNLDATGVADCLTPRTVALLPTHLYGKCCAMEPLLALAAARNLAVIEDCAQAHGATYRGTRAGNFGDFGAFSFYPTKNLGALGDGGGITVRSAAAAAQLRALRNYGSATKYHNEIVGYNARLDEIQAGFLSVKLRRLEEINAHKCRLAHLYLQSLKDDFVKPVVHPDHADAYHIFCVRHPRRDALRQYLANHGIGTEIHYPVPPHRQPALRGLLTDAHLPLTDLIHATTLSLPLSYGHSGDDVYRVIEAMNRF